MHQNKKLVVFILFFSLSVFPKVYHVYEADGAQAIQDSINSATFYDTVMVHNGKYYIGDLAGERGIHLKSHQLMSVSPDSALNCTLTALSSSDTTVASSVVWDSTSAYGWSANVEGFTITEGSSNGILLKDWENSDFFIQNNIIQGNRFGIQCGSDWGLNFVIRKNEIKDNELGIFVWSHTSSGKIEENLIYNNYNDGYGHGGGIRIASTIGDDRSNAAIRKNLIINNYASEYGGGIYFSSYASGEIESNTIAYNEAGLRGGGIYFECGISSGSSLTGGDNVIVANRAKYGGGISSYLDTADSLDLYRIFAVDNSAEDRDGFAQLGYMGGISSAEITHSNIYYNTYQGWGEINVDTLSDTFNLSNNFWWYTDSSSIDSLISGPADLIPFEPWFVDSAPGEPTDIYSVLNYNSDYSTIVDSLGGDPDTLYLEITGNDRHSEFQEAAVAILKSDIYPTGIAVALLETDTASGIYRWKGIVKTTSPPDSIRIDDINQTIRVDPDGDTIKIIANMDNSEIFKVYYRCQGGMEGDFPEGFVIQPLQNPAFSKPEFRFFLPEENEVKLSLYDVSGRMVDNIISEKLSSGWHTVQGDVNLPGVYIYRIEIGNKKKSGKVVVVR